MEAEHSVDEYMWINFVSYMVLTYVMALRGNECLMLEIRGLQDQLNINSEMILYDSVVWGNQGRRSIYRTSITMRECD